MPNNLTAIDLFSGAGGFSLAAHNLGINVLASIENDKHATETYQNNIVRRLHSDTQVFGQDINDVDIDGMMKYQGLKQGKLDILLGGPPCQGFSTHRINNAGENDPRNQLLLRYFDFVKKLRPKAFLVENVPGLLWKRHKDYLEKFLKLTNDHKYQLVGGQPLIINARDYGVPQNRKRAFILALRNDISTEGLAWPPQPTHVKSGQNAWKTASVAFEKPSVSILKTLKKRHSQKFGLTAEESERCIENLEWGEPVEPGDPCSIHMQHSEELVKVFKSTPILGSRLDSMRQLECHATHTGHKDVYGRVYPHMPSNTITTGCNNPSKGRFVHPWRDHGITLRHAARLQSFPDDYAFCGGSIAVAKQIGNAVPVKLGESLIAAVRDHLIEVVRM